MPHASIALAHRGLRVVASAFCLLLSATGCGDGSPAGRPQPRLSLSASWKPVDREAFRVPGVALAAWSGPEGSSLIVYQTLPAPATTAETIVQSLVTRLRNLPGFQDVTGKVTTIGGEPAARVELVAPGSGSEIAPSGQGDAVAPEGKTLTPTREVTVGIPRAKGLLFMAWRMPDAAREKVMPEVESALAGVKLPPDDGPWSY